MPQLDYKQQQTRRWLLHERTETYEWSQKLHDHLQQMIVVAKMMLEKRQMGRSEQETGEKQIRDVIQILNEAIDESRSLSRDLCPPLLFKNGLKPSLEWLTYWASGHYGMPVKLSFDLKDGPFPEESGHYLIRLIKRILRKVQSAARMTQSELKISKEGSGELRLNLLIETQQQAVKESSNLKDKLGDIGEYMTMLDGKCHIDVQKDGSILISMLFPAYLT